MTGADLSDDALLCEWAASTTNETLVEWAERREASMPLNEKLARIVDQATTAPGPRRPLVLVGSYAELTSAALWHVIQTGHPPKACRAHPRTITGVALTVPHTGDYLGVRPSMQLCGVPVTEDETVPEGRFEITVDEGP